MDPLTQILAAAIIAIVSGLIGKAIGGYKKVSVQQCSERRVACNQLILEKLDSLEKIIQAHIRSRGIGHYICIYSVIFLVH